MRKILSYPTIIIFLIGFFGCTQKSSEVEEMKSVLQQLNATMKGMAAKQNLDISARAEATIEEQLAPYFQAMETLEGIDVYRCPPEFRAAWRSFAENALRVRDLMKHLVPVMEFTAEIQELENEIGNRPPSPLQQQKHESLKRAGKYIMEQFERKTGLSSSDQEMQSLNRAIAHSLAELVTVAQDAGVDKQFINEFFKQQQSALQGVN